MPARVYEIRYQLVGQFIKQPSRNQLHTILPLTLRDVPYISIICDGRDVLVSRAFHLYNSPDVHRLFRRIPAMGETLRRLQTDPWYFHSNPDQLLCHETMVRESLAWWCEHLKSDHEVQVKSWVKDEANETLTQFGYVDSPNW